MVDTGQDAPLELAPLDLVLGEAALAADLITAWKTLGQAVLATDLIWA